MKDIFDFELFGLYTELQNFWKLEFERYFW